MTDVASPGLRPVRSGGFDAPFVEGFSRRTGLRTMTRVAGDVDGIPAEMQPAILRVVREALVNIRRPAEATMVSVVLRRNAAGLHLRVGDDGKGLRSKRAQAAAPQVALGVGIPGMETRIRQFGGGMTIIRGGRGTTIRAFNRWVGDAFAAATGLDSDLGLDISGAIGLEINGENADTDYRSGNAFHVDLSISKNLSKEFSVGVLAGYYDQVSGDGGEGNRIGPFKGRVAAIGATAGYNITVAGTPASTRIKVLREVDVENRPQGTIGLFTAAFPLGGHRPPAAPQPIRARY